MRVAAASLCMQPCTPWHAHVQRHILCAHLSHNCSCMLCMQGELRTEFFDLIELNDWTGKGIWEAVKKRFAERGIELRGRLVSLGTDGASNLTS